MDYSFTVLSGATDIVQEAIESGSSEEDALKIFLESLQNDIHEQLIRRGVA